MTVQNLSTQNRQAAAQAVPGRKLWLAGLASIVAAIGANIVLLFIVRAVVDLPAGFLPLQPGPIIFFTLLGTGLGVLVFALINRRARNPLRTYTLLALIALVISILPNLGLMANPAGAPFPGGTAQTFGLLILFHLVAAATHLGVLSWMVRR